MYLKIGLPMDNISVPFRTSHLVLSTTEAEELIVRLTHEVERNKRAESSIRPIEVDTDGYLTIDSFYAFFVQIYSSRSHLRNHAGKLFGRIISLARTNTIGFNVICTACGNHVSEKCEGNLHLHMSHYDKFKVEAASLKQHADRFLSGTFRLVGPSVRTDFQLLIGNI